MLDRQVVATAGFLMLAMWSPASAQSTTPPVPTIEEVLPTVFRALAGHLPDARGITDMRVCVPTHVRRARSGQVTGYTVSMQLNAPNSQGGMSGRRVLYVIVRDGRGRIVDGGFQRPADNGGQPGGIDGLLGERAMRNVEGCQRISDDQVAAELLKIDGE